MIKLYYNTLLLLQNLFVNVQGNLIYKNDDKKELSSYF